MKRQERSLDDLAKAMEPFPQVLYNVEVKAKRELSEIPEVNQKVKAIEKALGHSGRILIRYSGTEPILRIMVEGEDEARLHKLAQEMVEEVRKHLS